MWSALRALAEHVALSRRLADPRRLALSRVGDFSAQHLNEIPGGNSSKRRLEQIGGRLLKLTQYFALPLLKDNHVAVAKIERVHLIA